MSSSDQKTRFDSSTPESGDKENRSQGSYNNNKYCSNSGKHQKKSADKPSSFQGSCPELKGFTLTCNDPNQTKIYEDTVKELGNLAARTLAFGDDAKEAIDTLQDPIFEEPTDYADDGASKTKIRLWEKAVDTHALRISYFRTNLKKLFHMVWAQCTKQLQARLKSTAGFKDVSAKANLLKFLLAVKAIVHGIQGERYRPMTIVDHMKKLYAVKQTNQDLAAHYKYFHTTLDVVRHTGGGGSIHIGAMQYVASLASVDLRSADTDTTAAITAKDEARYLAALFLASVNRSTYGGALDVLHNDHIRG